MASFCSNCGAQLSENAKFCVSCGQAAAREQPATFVPQPQPAAQPAQPDWQARQPQQAQTAIPVAQAQYQQPYAAPAAPKKKKGNSIVGKWGYSISFKNWTDIVSGRFIKGQYASTGEGAEGIEFFENGTFHFYRESKDSYAAGNGHSQYKGNYKVEGNIIYLTNVTKSWTDFDDPKDSYDFKPVSDHRLEFEINENDVMTCRLVDDEGIYPIYPWKRIVD